MCAMDADIGTRTRPPTHAAAHCLTGQSLWRRQWRTSRRWLVLQNSRSILSQGTSRI
jgi:hypothetical protein